MLGAVGSNALDEPAIRELLRLGEAVTSDAELRDVVDAWASVPLSLRSAIIAIVRSASRA